MSVASERDSVEAGDPAACEAAGAIVESDGATDCASIDVEMARAQNAVMMLRDRDERTLPPGSSTGAGESSESSTTRSTAHDDVQSGRAWSVLKGGDG